MKKLLILLLLLISHKIVKSQDKDIFKDQLFAYFKTSPFGKTRDSILKELVADSDLGIDTVILLTNPSKFYVRGYYKNFNPFTQKMSRIELLVFEVSHVIDGNEKRNKKKRELAFQITGITDSTIAGRLTATAAEESISATLKTYYPINYKKEAPDTAKNHGYKNYYYREGYPQATSGVGMWYQDLKSYCVSVRIDLEFINKVDSLLNAR